MLSRLLHVRRPTAKQAVITAIDLLGTHIIVHACKMKIFSIVFLFIWLTRGSDLLAFSYEFSNSNKSKLYNTVDVYSVR